MDRIADVVAEAVRESLTRSEVTLRYSNPFNLDPALARYLHPNLFSLHPALARYLLPRWRPKVKEGLRHTSALLAYK